MCQPMCLLLHLQGQKGLRRESRKSLAVNADFLLFGWSAGIPSESLSPEMCQLQGILEVMAEFHGAAPHQEFLSSRVVSGSGKEIPLHKFAIQLFE